MDKDEKSGEKEKDDIKDEDVKEDGKDKTETKTESEGAQEQRELSEVIITAQQQAMVLEQTTPEAGENLKTSNFINIISSYFWSSEILSKFEKKSVILN